MLKEKQEVSVIAQQRGNRSRVVFKYLNKYYMVPAQKIGLFPWMLDPLTGYILVLKTIGRKSGKERLTPLNYAIANGFVYCMAGFDSGTDWLNNLKAYPTVEVGLAGTTFRGKAEVVIDYLEAQYAFLHIIRNCGFASLLIGLNPLTLTDGKILAKRRSEVVVRIRPTETIGGPCDPGQKGWILPSIASIAFFLWLGGLIFRRNKADCRK